MTMIDQAQSVVVLLERAINTVPLALGRRNIKSNLYRYVECFQRGMVVTLILRAAYGWDFILDTNHQSIAALVLWLNTCPTVTQADKDYYNFWVQPLIDYIFHWVIPSNHPTCQFSKIVGYKYRTFHDSITRTGRNGAGRLSNPVWTDNYVNGQRISPHFAAVCDGHYREYFLMVDLVEKDFASKLKTDVFYVSNAW